jgi:hypothetical protein
MPNPNPSIGVDVDLDLRAETAKVVIDGTHFDPRTIVADSITVISGTVDITKVSISFYVRRLRMVPPDGALMTLNEPSSLNMLKPAPDGAP